MISEIPFPEWKELAIDACKQQGRRYIEHVTLIFDFHWKETNMQEAWVRLHNFLESNENLTKADIGLIVKTLKDNNK